MKTDEQTLREALEDIAKVRDWLEKSYPHRHPGHETLTDAIRRIKALQATNTPTEYETPEEYTKP